MSGQLQYECKVYLETVKKVMTFENFKYTGWLIVCRKYCINRFRTQFLNKSTMGYIASDKSDTT